MPFCHLWSGQDQRLSWSRLWGIWSCMIREYSTRSPQSGELRLKSSAQALSQKSSSRIRGLWVKRRVLIKEFPATSLHLSQDHSDRRPKTGIATESLQSGVCLQESWSKSPKFEKRDTTYEHSQQIEYVICCKIILYSIHIQCIQNVDGRLWRTSSSNSFELTTIHTNSMCISFFFNLSCLMFWGALLIQTVT